MYISPRLYLASSPGSSLASVHYTLVLTFIWVQRSYNKYACTRHREPGDEARLYLQSTLAMTLCIHDIEYHNMFLSPLQSTVAAVAHSIPTSKPKKVNLHTNTCTCIHVCKIEYVCVCILCTCSCMHVCHQCVALGGVRQCIYMYMYAFLV